MPEEKQATEFRQIGEFIRRRRQELNISLEQLGREVGVSAAAISRYELGQRSLSWTMCDKIMRALGMEIGDGVMIYLNEMAGNTLDNYLSSLCNDDIVVDTTQTSEGLELEEIRGKIEKGTATLEEMQRYKAFVEKATDSLQTSLKAIRVSLSSLNAKGQQKAVERVEELTEIPKYQRQTPENAGEVPDTPSEGKDTTQDD